MAYTITSEYLDDPVSIYIPENLSGGGSQAVIVYESPGSNGGIIIGTGRTNESLSISGKILSKLKYPSTAQEVQNDVNDKAAQLQDIKDNGFPITINGSLPTNKTGTFILTDFNWSKGAGQLKYVSFTMTLQELRQVNTKQTEINLLGAVAIKAMQDTKIARGLI